MVELLFYVPCRRSDPWSFVSASRFDDPVTVRELILAVDSVARCNSVVILSRPGSLGLAAVSASREEITARPSPHAGTVATVELGTHADERTPRLRGGAITGPMLVLVAGTVADELIGAHRGQPEWARPVP